MAERQEATNLAGIEVKHKARYEWAIPHCKNKIVMDFGCGVGYGSNMLATTANYVFGYDRSAKAIAAARLHYQRSNIRFDILDITTNKKNIGYELDTIVALEVIEHITYSIKETLCILKNTLVKGGILVFSHPENETSGNKFHYHMQIKGDEIKRKLLPTIKFDLLDEWIQPGNNRYDYHIYAIKSR